MPVWVGFACVYLFEPFSFDAKCKYQRQIVAQPDVREELFHLFAYRLPGLVSGELAFGDAVRGKQIDQRVKLPFSDAFVRVERCKE